MTDDTAESDRIEQREVRLAKRKRLLEHGVQAYPVGVPITTTIASLRERFGGLGPDTATGERAAVAGRIVHLRNTGKLCFAALQAGDVPLAAGAAGPSRIQAMVSLDAVGEESLAEFKALVDLGDQLFVAGEVITSRRGELSIRVDEWRIAAKALLPLPNLHAELSEETRVRSRYLDLIARPAARDMVRTRAVAVASLRSTFAERGYLELETPMLQVQHGGASARPFVTHSNAFDTDLYLRIAPELFLKRAVVGGLERVYEINRNFRNEGADSTHSPEFAMLEFYEAYATYDTNAVMTRELVQEAAQSVFGTQVVTLHDGTEYDLSGEWTTLSMYESLSEALGEEVTPETPAELLRKHAQRVGAELDPKLGHGKLVEELWEHLVSGQLHAPTFVRDFPIETSPLTRQHRSIPGVAEKWDLYVRGFELATGYSELVDPVVERERLTEQSRLGAAGDDEAMQLDEDFLRALEYGMPPSGGVGMGIDRLLMAMTGLGMRETILFPLVKPE